MAARYTYYRQFFTVQLTHNTFPGIACDAFALEPDIKTKQLLLDKKMRYKQEPGKVTIYYSGEADPTNVPPIIDDKMIPYTGIDNNTEFMFIIKVVNAELIKRIAVPSPTTTPAFNFKTLATAVPWHYVKQSVFTVLFKASVSAKVFETFVVKDIKGKTVITGDVRKNNQGQFQCSADMSLCTPGFYSMEIGTGKEHFYLDTHSEMADKYGFIRVVKDNTWAMPKGIYDAAKYNVFTYEFPAATYAITI